MAGEAAGFSLAALGTLLSKARSQGLLLAVLLLLLPKGAAAQVLGAQMPRFELEGISQSNATQAAEFEGRALLLEFFAHW